MELGLSPRHIVLDGVPVASNKKGAQLPMFAYISCGQTAGWIKTPVGRKIDLGAGYSVLDGDLAPPKWHSTPPLFGL